MASIRLPVRPIDPEINEIVGSVGRNPEHLLDVLRTLQQRHHGVTPEMIEDVAKAMSIPPARAYGVATFYSMLRMPPDPEPPLYICDGVVCWMKGSKELIDQARQSGRTVHRSSCLGLCDYAPAANLLGEQYGPLNLGAPLPGDSSEATVRLEFPPAKRTGEVRTLLHDIETINPFDIDSAIEHGAYQAIRSILSEATPPEHVLSEIERSGILGRGGAGFPTGRKWRAAARESNTPKYVICNADESEPLTFKDRILMETNPHQVLEGMLLCGYAIGSERGIIYIRGEYEPQAKILEVALDQARERNLLGANILGSGFSFDIYIHRGAGAYICGEGSALLTSLEGRRGLPRFRPPRSTTSGFKGQPTVVNNVETFAAAAWVALHGADTYLATGNPEYPGTRLYAVLGHVRSTGIFEAPYRITLRQIIEDFGGGMLPGSRFKFALTGGAAGTIVDQSLLDTPIDFDSARHGIIPGAGGFLICDETVSPLALLRELAWFFEQESCGKCTPCRIGTTRLRVMLDRMLDSGPLPGDFVELRDLAGTLRRDSFCALGVSVADPLESALLHFPNLFQPEIDA